MKVKEKTNSNKVVNVDPEVDKLDSGRIGAGKKSQLKKYKNAILASVNRHRDR